MSNSFYIAFSIVAQICATMLFFSCASLRYKVYNENKLTKELSAYIVDMVYIDNPSIIEFSNVHIGNSVLVKIVSQNKGYFIPPPPKKKKIFNTNIDIILI